MICKYGFLDFPPEIRMMIYPFVFEVQDTKERRYLESRSHGFREVRSSSQLLRTCKTVYHEAIACFYEPCLCSIDYHTTITGTFLDPIKMHVNVIGALNAKYIHHIIVSDKEAAFRYQHLSLIYRNKHRINIRSFRVVDMEELRMPSEGTRRSGRLRETLVFVLQLAHICPNLCRYVVNAGLVGGYSAHLRVLAEGVKLEPLVSLSPCYGKPQMVLTETGTRTRFTGSEGVFQDR